MSTVRNNQPVDAVNKYEEKAMPIMADHRDRSKDPKMKILQDPENAFLLKKLHWPRKIFHFGRSEARGDVLSLIHI